MDKDAERSHFMMRRALVVGGAQTGLLGVLLGRMYYLQVIEADKYKTRADENRINMTLIAPRRGVIQDRFGVDVATNVQNFKIVLVAEQVPDLNEILGRLSKFLPLTEDDFVRIERDVKKTSRFLPVTIKENLTWKQVSEIDAHAPYLPGVSIEVGDLRYYPFAEAGAHILGYVGVPNKKEIKNSYNPLYQILDFHIGKEGLEKSYEEVLRGVAGTKKLEVNAYGRTIRELSVDESQKGKTLGLTIDMELQEFAQKRLSQEQSAAAVVMDIHNGDVYAMASHPTYNPNDFVLGLDIETWRGILANSKHPLTNKALKGRYAPGSTFKMVVLLAALEEGIIGPDFEVTCNGYMELGNHRFHCWKRGGHGPLNMVQALERSCDVYLYEVALKVGIEKIAAMAHRLGLGEKTDIDMPSESMGLIPDKEWKERAIGERWQKGETVVASIGQGYVLATPMQLAVMTSRIANGGRAVKPRLVRRIGAENFADGAELDWPSLGIKPEHLEIVRAGMTAVMEAKHGTARHAQIPEERMHMAGKTGTSQVRRISREERAKGVLKNEEQEWLLRDHALFVGYAPLDNPKFACSVIVEHGGGGSTVAAPVARDLLEKVQQRYEAFNNGTLSPVSPSEEP